MVATFMAISSISYRIVLGGMSVLRTGPWSPRPIGPSLVRIWASNSLFCLRSFFSFVFFLPLFFLWRIWGEKETMGPHYDSRGVGDRIWLEAGKCDTAAAIALRAACSGIVRYKNTHTPASLNSTLPLAHPPHLRLSQGLRAHDGRLGCLGGSESRPGRALVGPGLVPCPVTPALNVYGESGRKRQGMG